MSLALSGIERNSGCVSVTLLEPVSSGSGVLEPELYDA
ncbi:hypothetical protein KPSA3_02131 [Pseudomonas syringae pv. actinidiae]|uniref:Uncharacterized protein n=1 Tax=Pseudomonas syringae pv. actinidiae TaxID=103796 RepID=A0AAN4Q3F2_PSESF|nr:hypothetical protein KPSA3_02131 [Pseudomonas syringae pv. actinidiae]